MSSPSNQDLPRSMKNLWTLLSGSLHLKSTEFIAKELEQSERQLIEGILFYKPHDPKKNSLDELIKKKVPQIRPHIWHNMSAFLDLEADQCYNLFQSYLLFEYKGTPEMARSLFSSEKQIKELFESLWYYYYSERIFTLFCFKQILSNWKDTNHSYQQIFNDFLRRINTDNNLLDQLLKQLKFLINFDADSKAKFGPNFSEKFQADHKENILKEQSEILQLLLLYYKNFEPTVENVHDLLTLFIENGFGPKNNSSTTDLDNFISFLKTLLIVECLDPNHLYKCHLEEIEHFILKPDNSDTIEKINTLILNMNTSVPEHSLIFLCWMIISVLENGENVDQVERLGTTALELKVFRQLFRNLHLPQTIALKGSFMSTLIHEIVGNLLGVTFTTFDFEKLIQTEPSLGHLLIQLFSNNVIAKMVFDSSLASGLGLSLRYALDLFPYKTHFLLNLLHSLAQSKSCKNIFETMSILGTLTSYTEPFDSSFTHFAPLNAENFILIKDKQIMEGCKIVLPKETKGVMLHHEGNRLIKWNNVTMNGWRFLFYRLRYLTDQIRQGQMYASLLNDEVVLNEISTVAFICSQLIAHGAHQSVSHFRSIVLLLLETFKLMVNVSQASIRLFMAGIIQLCANVMKHGYLPSEQIWFLLTEKKFFPYMIGFSTALPEVLAGQDSNISTLGYILSTDEFIRGNYELTFSFLEFMQHCVRREELLKENAIIASFLFIIRDVFPSHRLWNYRSEQDAHRIGRLCMDIFYQVLRRARRRRKQPAGAAGSSLEQIEQICTILLMEGSSAEYLLHVVKNGEQTVQEKIISSGNDVLLVEDDQMIMVRTSLLILSFLLELYSEVSSQQQQGEEEASPKSKSVIEELLFSSSNTNTANPNMLLIFTYFVYQKVDIFLATNAMKLLSQLAFKFPMSMLACFGSHTEAIRDQFLFRLEAVTEDINFKIALLNFLSICVEHQPGLVEMFLSVSDHQSGVLSSILEILEEKLEGVYFCPFELHQASLQFIAKFWLRPNIIAINLLKENGKFWKLITFPLFTGGEKKFNDSLCSYILKILSREMFYSKMLEKDTLNNELEAIFKRIQAESIIEKLSTHIHTQIIEPRQIDDSTLALIDAWRDFLSSWTMFKQMTSDSLSSTIVNGLLENLSALLGSNTNGAYTKIVNKLSNLLLLITSNWKPSVVESLKKTDFADNIVQLFGAVLQNKDVISFNALVSLSSCLLKVLLCFPEMNQLNRLFHHVVQLLNSCIQLMNKQLATSAKAVVSCQGTATPNLSLEKKLIHVHLSIVIHMLANVKQQPQQQQQQQQHIGKYLDVLRKYEITEMVFNLLVYLLHNSAHLDLAQALPLLFVAVSRHEAGAELLHSQNVVNNLAIYFRLPAQLFGQQQQQQQLQGATRRPNAAPVVVVDAVELAYISQIFSLFIRTVINMTSHLKHHFVESAISFVAIYSDSLRELCTSFRQGRRLKHASLVLLTVSLCSSLSRYIKVWAKSHDSSLRLVAEQILLTSNSVIAFVMRPALLSADEFGSVVVGGQSTAASAGHVSFHLGGGGRQQQQQQQELPSSSQSVLLKILLHSFKFITDLAPDLFDLFEAESGDDVTGGGGGGGGSSGGGDQLLLSTNFSLPNADSLEVLTFGSLVNFINFDIKSIYKLEKDSIVQLRDQRAAAINEKINLDIALLEYSLTILLNQTLTAKNSSKINQMDKQIFFREINNEMNNITSNLSSKPPRRQNSFSSAASSVASPMKSQAINLMERQYIQLLLKLMDNVIQIQ